MVEEYYILQSKKKKRFCSCCFNDNKGEKCKSSNLEKFFYEQLLKEHNKMRSRLGYKPIQNDPNLLAEAKKCCEYIKSPDDNKMKTVCVYYDYEIRDHSGNVKAIYKQIDCFVARKACQDNECERKNAGENDRLVVGILYAEDKAQKKITRSVSTYIPGSNDCNIYNRTLTNPYKINTERKNKGAIKNKSI